MDDSNSIRVIILGKSGSGKSSLVNTILGETKFKISHFDDMKTCLSQSVTRVVNGRRLTLIDTPGFFDPSRSDQDTELALFSSLAECAPGPHAFLIVFKVEKFTEQERAVITQTCEQFSQDALGRAVIVFTRGDQLPEGEKIEDFVAQNEGLSDLVKECGGRCHIFDNKYWKSNQQDDYRSNQFQVGELLRSIDKIMIENNRAHYTNDKLKEVEREIQKEEKRIRQSSEIMSQEEIREEAKSRVVKKQNPPQTWCKSLVKVAVTAGLIVIVSAVLIRLRFWKVITVAPQLAAVEEDIVETFLGESQPEKPVSVPETPIRKAFEFIMDMLNALYERTYDPWNLFE